jgi:hypothetical protein
LPQESLYSAEAIFYRTAVGAEIDFVLQFADQIWVIDIKRTTAPKLSKGFYLTCEDIRPTTKFVVYSGEECYQLSEQITMLPLLDLLEKNQNSNRGTRYETSPTTKGARATPLLLWNPPPSCPRSKLRRIFSLKHNKKRYEL